MPTITRTGKPPMTTSGDLPKIGELAPEFTLTNTSMEEVTLASFKGKNVIINIFPSADTPTCELSIVKFNAEAISIPNTVVLCVSMDLPFAHKRFCAEKNTPNVISLSAFRNADFGKQYGVSIMDGYLRGLFARAVLAINPEGRIIHSELVKELTQQPNYTMCIQSVAKSVKDNADNGSDKKQTQELANTNVSASTPLVAFAMSTATAAAAAVTESVQSAKPTTMANK